MTVQITSLTENNFFRYSDTKMLALAKKVHDTFLALRRECYGVDDLHVLHAVQKAYREMDEEARSTYKSIVKHYCGEMDYYILDEIFNTPNPVTKYIWNTEVLRKQERLYESILAHRSQTLPDGRKMDDSGEPFKTAMNLWAKQIGQYSIYITDVAVLQRYRNEGVQFVVWVSEKDDRVCEICRKNDNVIYNINDISGDWPAHYNCRCVLLPANSQRRR